MASLFETVMMGLGYILRARGLGPLGKVCDDPGSLGSQF